MQFLSSCNPKVLLVHWVEQKLVKINKRDVFLWKQRVKSRALSVWSEFKRLHIREFKPKRDKTVHNSLVNPQQILAPECLFSTLVNLPSKGNCCSDLFPDVLSRVSDCVFPARENMHRFSRWAEVMGTHPPPLVLQCVQCTQLSVWWLCTLAVSFQGRLCLSSPPSPYDSGQLSYLHLGKPGSAPLKWKERQSLGKSFSRSWGLTSMFPYCDFRETSKTSFSAAQTCSHCSLIQSSCRRKPTSPQCKQLPEKGKRHRRDASPRQECDKPLHRLRCRPFVGRSIGEPGPFCHAVLWDKLAKRDVLFYL